MPEKIISVNSYEQYVEDMQKYAIYSTRHRAVPEYRDGLKPVHRKIVYCMYAVEKCISDATKVKSAAIVGSTMKKFHPHGDAAIYDAIKPLANWFEINKPLIVPHGNFGNFQGDTQAADRYTEAYLSKFAIDCVIGELKETKHVVDWIDTYDGKDKEPEFLPATVPLLLINGSFGIAVGIKVEIPRHNINEVIDATITLLNNPNAKIRLVPDHCIPCNIINTDFEDIGNKGNGSYKVRGIVDIEKYNGTRKEYSNRDVLVVKSIPDLTFLNTITDKVETLIENNVIIQIQDYEDESTDDEMRYIFILKKGADPLYTRDMLYKHTELEQSCRVNFEVLDGINPVRMSYRNYILSFLEFRKQTKFRLYCNVLQAIQTKIHEREIYIKVLQSGYIDDIIQMIRKQTSIDDTELIEYLIKKLKITDLQAKFIIGSDLRKLSKGYLNKYIEEAKLLNIDKNIYLDKISDERIIVQEIINELLSYKAKYGNKRRCKIINQSDASAVPKGIFKIIITQNNFIKKIPENDNITGFRNDSPKLIITADNTENILLFDNRGRVFKLPVSKIAFTDKNSNGIDIRLLVKHLTADINTIIYEPDISLMSKASTKYFMVVVTKNGYIKKMDLDDFLTVPTSGLIYSKLEPDDYVTDIMIISDMDVVVYSKNIALRMSIDDIPHLKRSTRGSRAMTTNNNIDGISVISHNISDIVIVTENGYINRFNASALPYIGRSRGGSKVIKLGSRDVIKYIYGVNNNDIIQITTKMGTNDIPVNTIELGSSISTGIKIIKTKADTILDCKIIKV